jgi:hypothetical protein
MVVDISSRTTCLRCKFLFRSLVWHHDELLRLGVPSRRIARSQVQDPVHLLLGHVPVQISWHIRRLLTTVSKSINHHPRSAVLESSFAKSPAASQA